MANLSRSMPAWLVLMGLVTMTSPLAINLYLPAFSVIEQALGAQSGELERTLAAYLVGMSVGQLIYGPVSDRFGRKPPLYVGLAIFGIASAGCALSSSVDELTVWRLVQALGSSACMVIPRAVIRDHYNSRDSARAMSLMMLIIGVAPLLAPVLGGQILAYASWRVIFATLAVISVGLLGAIHFSMTETVESSKTPRLSWINVARTYWELLRHRQFMMFASATGLGMAGFSAYLVASPHIYIEVYGVSPQSYGLLFASGAISMIGATQLNAYLLRRFRPSQLLRPALWALPTIGVVGTVLAACNWLPLPLLLLLVMLFMACNGFIGANATALATLEQGSRLGAALAMLGTFQFAGGAVVSALLSFWRTDSALAMLGLVAICGTLANMAGRRAVLTLVPKAGI